MKTKKNFFFLMGITCLIVSYSSYFLFYLPKVKKLPSIKVSYDTARMNRGQYLANYVLACTQCHGKRDWEKYSGPIMKGTIGWGGEIFNSEMGYPGKIVAPNISASVFTHWKDSEIISAIVNGISKDEKNLAPVMPYHLYAELSLEDVKDIAAYIKYLSPVSNYLPKTSLSFPMNLWVSTYPVDANPQKKPEKSDLVAYGEYLARAGMCMDCHSKQEDYKPIKPFYTGGRKFILRTGAEVMSTNLTPHATGIKNWTEKQFIATFRKFDPKKPLVNDLLGVGDYQTNMPWSQYAMMSDHDLKAIFFFLKSLHPVKNEVKPFLKPMENPYLE